MKTQKKELPNEFTFVCDEYSKEQLEKLGVENPYDYNIKDEAIYGYIFSVKNNLIIWFGGSDFNYPLINLSDYLDQEQPEQKWQEKTIGGYEYHIYEEFDGRIFGRGKSKNGEWHELRWCVDGKIDKLSKDEFDLVLIKNPIIEYLEKELEEVRSKEKEILEKIEQLKTK